MSYTISQLAKEFQMTTRTIRYYEELQLLTPERLEGRRRVYSKKDYTRLKLIVRGKRYGFTLEEIKEMIQLFDKDQTGNKQLERTIDYGKDKLKEVNDRIEELMEIKREMEALLVDFTNRLEKAREEEE